MQLFDTIDVARLEVEDDPTGLANLLANPSGDLGGWGWITPLASSAIAGGSQLTYTRTVSGASNFSSELVAVAAGQYVAARYTMAATPGTAYHRSRVEFYDSAGALLSSSAQSALTAPAALTPVNIGPFLAPASTAYVRLRFDLYTSAGANPTGSHTFGWREATVSKAALAADLGSVRTNLVTNPSGETNANLWSQYTPVASNSVTVSRDATLGYVGTACLKLTGAGGGPPPGTAEMRAQVVNVTGGATYALQARVRSAAVARNAKCRVTFVGPSGSTTYSGAPQLTTTGGWTLITMTASAPADAVQAYPAVVFDSVGLSEVHYWDAVLFEKASTVGTYFDGSTAAGGGWTYAWTGTAHASSSTATSSNLPYIEPVPYVNVLGSAGGTIETSQEGGNLGSVTATVYDNDLSPATNDLIRPGRRCRLTYLDTDGLWKPIFTGKVVEVSAEFNVKDPALVAMGKSTAVTFTAVDPWAALAGQIEERSVATVAELPYLLEGKGVPWSVNGSGNQVTTATVRATTDGATMMDQVLTTRDTALGYAWMDRYGVLQVWDNASLPTTPYAYTLDESAYSEATPAFDTEGTINEVGVTRVRTKGNGETVEDVFGPYRNAASIAQWGVYHADFRIVPAGGAGATEAAALAAAVLAANATPAVRLTTVTLPIRNDTERSRWCGLGLYQAVTVVNTASGVNTTMVVRALRHRIEAQARVWVVEVDLQVITRRVRPRRRGLSRVAVAGARFLPSGGGSAPYVNRNRTGTQSITSATWTTWVPGTQREGGGIDHDGSGLFTVTAEGLYVMTAAIAWTGNATGRRALRWVINSGATSPECVIENKVPDANDFSQTLTYVRRLAVGETIRLQVWHNVGAALTTVADNTRCNLQLARVGD